jgi:putative nucleotidyltransferase with HDIG domain
LCERSYYLADFPATAAALEEQVLCAISADDPLADPAELFVLREAEMQAVLLVPVVVDGRAWGLIEIYDGRPRRFSALERHLAELGAAQISALLAGFEHAEAVERLYRETLASLSNALEAKDEYTRHHTEEVVRLALAVAAELDLEPQAARNVELGAILHDVGKVRVPEPILNKPGQLDDAEWAIMKTHPEVGEHILAPIQLLRPILPIVRHHHERWDGGGYPDGLAARAIPPWRPHRRRLRRLPSNDRRPTLPPSAFGSGSASTARARKRKPVRRRMRRCSPPRARPTSAERRDRRPASSLLG